MSFEELQISIRRDSGPSAGLQPAVQALWHDAKGDWNFAHRVAQEDATAEGSWVHAYLHRKEGDLSNARYWYARAGRSIPAGEVTLEDEWAAIAHALLAR